MAAFALDTNVFLLFIVGSANSEWIEKHKRLQKYTQPDYWLLLNLIGNSELHITPNVATEADNILSGGLRPPATDILKEKLAEILEDVTEHYEHSATIGKQPEYRWLGLADVAWLECVPSGATLITDDLLLFAEALAREISTVNFNRIRDGVTIG